MESESKVMNSHVSCGSRKMVMHPPKHGNFTRPKSEGFIHQFILSVWLPYVTINRIELPEGPSRMVSLVTIRQIWNTNHFYIMFLWFPHEFSISLSPQIWKITISSWENQLFLLPFSSSQTVNVYQARYLQQQTSNNIKQNHLPHVPHVYSFL